MTTLWPSDHPGRKCRLCDARVYALWVGETPPPGTCYRGAATARDCPDVLDTILLQQFLKSKGVGDGRRGDALMARAGYTQKEIDRERILREDIERERLPLMYGGATVEIGGVALRDWLDVDDPRPRCLALLDEIKTIVHAKVADGTRTMFEISAWLDDLKARIDRVFEDLSDIDCDGELDEGE